MIVKTRFAPSPTGQLHIGGARTALFNYLYAKKHNGKFDLRIEDTDKKRSTKKATQVILDSLKWLGLEYDNIVYQSQNEKQHVQIAEALLAKGAAYLCYTSQEEVNARRDESFKKGQHFRFHSEWRNKNSKLAPKDAKPTIRIKSPETGFVKIDDAVQGSVEINAKQLDDMILLRSDSTPTYMLAVVVDDHNMGVTHIIRGDDHLNNAFRQQIIYNAMEWQTPTLAHIPLIHGSDGKKLSKRHGDAGLDFYEKEGFLSDTIFNYLLRLGWSHGDDELISREQAIKWFNLESLGKSPSKLDLDKMKNLNSHYLKNKDDNILIGLLEKNCDLSGVAKEYLQKGISSIKTRSKTMLDLKEGCKVYLSSAPIAKDQKANEVIKSFDHNITNLLIDTLQKLLVWDEESLKNSLKLFTAQHGLKLGLIAQFIRVQLTGTVVSPSVFEVMSILGKNETIKRLEDY